jgi:hypothetical protein
MAEKKKYPIYTSPKGVAKYVNLNNPQTSININGEAKPVDPNYSVTLLVDPSDATTIEFVETIMKMHTDALAAERKANPKKKYKDEGIVNMISDETDKDGSPTGKTALKFKHKASGERRDKSVWTYKPALFDAAGKPLPSGVVIFGGSVLKVAYGVKHTPMPTGSFYTSLQLQAVQVLDLKSEYVKEASAYGFSSEEGYMGEGQENAFGEQATTDEAASAAASTDF